LNRLNIEKVIVHETICFILVLRAFWPKMAPQDGPRSPQDGSKIVLDRFFRLLNFRFDFGSFSVSFSGPIWPPKWPPRGAHEPVLRALGGVQDGLEIVLVRFSCRLVVRDRFFGRLGVVFGWSRGRFGAFSAFQPIDSTHQLLDSTHQLINPWPFGTFQPGPADFALRD